MNDLDEVKPIYTRDCVVLDKYRVKRLLGRGAFGEVYLVDHLNLNVQRVIKAVAREREGMGSTVYGMFFERFKQEANLGARLNHPNVIHVYDLGKDGQTLVLEMEYAAGGSLQDRLEKAAREGRPLEVAEVVRIGRELAAGLGALHGMDVVHRDLKPSNVLFDGTGCAKIADLGLAQVRHGASQRSIMSDAAHHPGTPAYMSPEQESSFGYLTPPSDIYTLGLILFEMLTGRGFRNVRPGTRPRQLRAETPEWLDDLVMRMVSRAPEERPWDGQETAGLLEGKAGSPTGAPTETEEQRMRREMEEKLRQAEALKEKKAAEEKARLEMENRIRQELETKQRREQEEQVRQAAERQKAQDLEAQPLMLDLGGGVRMDFCWVPAGSFWMGDNQSDWDDEKPKHQVDLPGYWMSRYPVTNVQYQIFTRETQHREPSGGYPAKKDNHPIVKVTWHDAMAFTRWLNQKFRGKLTQGTCLRLPTEAEWEKAARGTDGRAWPWGNNEPNSGLCNFEDSKIRDTTPVGKYSPGGDSPYGCADMAGNVWEWTQSREMSYPYQAGSGRRDEDAANPHAVRGGSYCDCADGLRCAYRDFCETDYFLNNGGFRVCVGPILT